MKQALSGHPAAAGRRSRGTQSMRVVTCDAPALLMRIHEPSVNGVVWRRTPEPSVLRAWDEACPTGSTVVDGIVRPGPLGASAAEPGLDAPLSDRFGAFAPDVLMLSRWLAHVAGCVEVRARMVSLDDDQCRLFHVDAPALRILSTYVGPGTQWVDNDAVRRERLGTGGLSADAFNRALLLPGAAVYQARAGWVCLQKGDAYPGGLGRAVVHRSPPIEGTGTRRLRLTLEPSGYCRYGPP